ncbi:MAG: hypothetical protein ACR2JC_05130 [Chloroflexota bacterium]|nr:MAG: hypothetical protein DLM70_05250 [Chloroflexota bacterium]
MTLASTTFRAMNTEIALLSPETGSRYQGALSPIDGGAQFVRGVFALSPSDRTWTRSGPAAFHAPDLLTGTCSPPGRSRFRMSTYFRVEQAGNVTGQIRIYHTIRAIRGPSPGQRPTGRTWPRPTTSWSREERISILPAEIAAQEEPVGPLLNYQEALIEQSIENTSDDMMGGAAPPLSAPAHP